MKYYAVTEDPNELFHYGRLGMKWGQHIFGDKSPAFRRAAGKLRAAKVAVMKTPAQRDMSRVQKQQNRMQKKVARDQRRASKIRSINAANKKKEQTRANLVNAMATLDQEDNFRKQFNRDFRAAQKAQKYQRKLDNYAVKRDLIDQKNEVKTMRKSNKAERKLSKYTEQARRGKLKYGKLTDEQIQKVQDRLNAEQRTRNLGSAEKTYRQMRKEALRKGILQGIERGTGAAMEEVARGIVKNKFANRRVLNKQSKQQAKRDKEARQIRDQKSHKDVKDELKQEAYEAKIRNGGSVLDDNGYKIRNYKTVSGAAELLKQIEKKKLDEKNDRDFENQLRNAQNQELVDYAKGSGKLNGDTDIKKLLKSKQLLKDYDRDRQASSQAKEKAYKTFIKALKDKYDKDIDEYNQKYTNYQKAFDNWVSQNRKGDEPSPPKMPERPLELSLNFAEYETARSLGLLGSGNGGGKPKKK